MASVGVITDAVVGQQLLILVVPAGTQALGRRCTGVVLDPDASNSARNEKRSVQSGSLTTKKMVPQRRKENRAEDLIDTMEMKI